MRRFLPLIILVVLGGAYAGYRWWLSRQPYEWSGTVEAHTIDVGSRAGGRVKQVLVKEGDHVDQGKVLLVLEPGDLDAQRLVAKAQLDQATANLAKLKNGARPEEIAAATARAQAANAAAAETRAGARSEEVAAAKAREEAAQVAVDKAQIDADRAHRLVASGAAAQADVDLADTTLRAAKANRDAASQGYGQLKSGSRPEDRRQAAARADEAQANAKLVAGSARVEDLQAAQAQVDAAQGKLDSIDVMRGELEIKAPRAARVEALELRPGDIVAPNATAATLLEDGQLFVRIYVPETLIGRIQVQQEVAVTVDSFPGKSFKAKVEHINDVGEYSPRNLQTADERADQMFAARLGLLEGTGELRAGMAASIKVPK